MYADTQTPDGYTVNADGAWTEHGIVQTRNISSENGTTGQTTTDVENFENYDVIFMDYPKMEQVFFSV